MMRNYKFYCIAAALSALFAGCSETPNGGAKGFGQEPWRGAKCGGEEILCYGDCMVYQGAPDLADDSPTFQTGNNSPLSKIKVKKSGEIKSNFIGVDTTRMPRTRALDYYYSSPAHLIDGDTETCWISNGQRRADVHPTWIRVDFPSERQVSKVVLKKRQKDVARQPYSKLPFKGAQEFGRGMPSKMSVELSADGFNWKKIFDGKVEGSDKNMVFEFPCEPTTAKMVRVVATEIPRVECEGHCFTIGEFEVYDASGKNVALASNGSAALASSSYNYNRFPYEFHSALWKLHSEIGIKYARIGFHDDPINWHEVERERGVLKVDPAADEAIDGFVNDGIKIVMCLNFGNRLYTGQNGVVNGKVVDSKRDLPQMPEWHYDMPAPPSSDEALAAWDRYVEFMAKRYAGKVEYFEVWNEWNIGVYWGAEKRDYELFKNIAMRSLKILRRVAPDTKVMLGSPAGFRFGCHKWTPEQWKNPNEREMINLKIRAFADLAKHFDAVGIHPYYKASPDRLEKYDLDLPCLKKFLADNGFKGVIMVSEWNSASTYPGIPPEEAGSVWNGKSNFTEIQKAKIVSQRYMCDTGRAMPSFFCELYNPFYGAFELSLLRRATDEGACVLQPDAAFYATRNIATITDGFKPAKLGLKVVRRKQDARELKQFEFETPDGGKAVALWLGYEVANSSPRTEVDLHIGKADFAEAVDVLNGAKQILKIENGVVKGLLINDTPLVVRFR